jgi:hypothetical protein
MHTQCISTLSSSPVNYQSVFEINVFDGDVTAEYLIPLSVTTMVFFF